MEKRFEEIKSYVSKQKEKGYSVDPDIQWLIEKVEEQAELIEQMDSAIDSLNGR